MKNGNGGLLVVLEGPDGSGKSTQANRLVEWLLARGIQALHLRDPGGTPLGEKIRALLLDRGSSDLRPMAEALLYMASRAQLVAERIRPALEAGRVVVCERWLHSTVCYQGFGAGLDPETVWRIGEEASLGLRPDLTLILDVAAEVGLSRVGDDPDRVESLSGDFHRRVRAGYLAVAREGRQAATLVPGGDPDEVFARVREAVEHVL